MKSVEPPRKNISTSYLIPKSYFTRWTGCSRCAGRARGREGGGRKVDHFNGDERGCAAVAARAADAAAGNNNTFIHPDSSLVSGMAARYQDMRPPHKNVPAPSCCHTAPKRSYPTLPPYRTKARSPFAVSLSPFHAQKRAPPLQFPAQTRISPLLTQTINIHRWFFIFGL